MFVFYFICFLCYYFFLWLPVKNFMLYVGISKLNWITTAFCVSVNWSPVSELHCRAERRWGFGCQTLNLTGHANWALLLWCKIYKYISTQESQMWWWIINIKAVMHFCLFSFTAQVSYYVKKCKHSTPANVHTEIGECLLNSNCEDTFKNSFVKLKHCSPFFFCLTNLAACQVKPCPWHWLTEKKKFAGLLCELWKLLQPSNVTKKKRQKLKTGFICLKGVVPEALLKERLDVETLDALGIVPSQKAFNQKYVRTKTKLLCVYILLLLKQNRQYSTFVLRW